MLKKLLCLFWIVCFNKQLLAQCNFIKGFQKNTFDIKAIPCNKFIVMGDSFYESLKKDLDNNMQINIYQDSLIATYIQQTTNLKEEITLKNQIIFYKIREIEKISEQNLVLSKNINNLTSKLHKKNFFLKFGIPSAFIVGVVSSIILIK